MCPEAKAQQHKARNHDGRCGGGPQPGRGRIPSHPVELPVNNDEAGDGQDAERRLANALPHKFS